MKTPKEFAEKIKELSSRPWDSGDSISMECDSFLKELELGPSTDDIKKAFGEIEYKYFGDYELNKEQWEAIKTLCDSAAFFHGIKSPIY